MMHGRAAIQAFLERGARRHRLVATAATAGAHAVPLTVGSLIVEVARPSWTSVAIGVALAWVVAVTVTVWLRTRLPIAAADRALDLRDALQTWVGVDRAERQPGPMRHWLDQVLGQRLQALPESSLGDACRRPLGSVRYLIPILVVLLLFRGFALPLPPNTLDSRGDRAQSSGGGGGGRGRNGTGSGSGPSQSSGSGSDSPSDSSAPNGDPDSTDQPSQPQNPARDASEPDQPDPAGQPEPEPDSPDPTRPDPNQPDPNQPDASPQDAPPQPPPDRAPAGDAESPKLPPKAIPELPTQEEFLIPDFIDEGATRSDLVRQALRAVGPAPVAADDPAGTPPDPARGASDADSPGSGRPDSNSPGATSPNPDSPAVDSTGPGGSGGRTAQRPPVAPPPTEFERAAERALRSPWMPVSERSFVRRYFDALVQRVPADAPAKTPASRGGAANPTRRAADSADRTPGARGPDRR